MSSIETGKMYDDPESVPPCLFPKLLDGQLGAYTWRENHVSSIPLTEFQNAPTNTVSLLGAIWPVTLHEFIPVDLISFRYNIHDQVDGVRYPVGEYLISTPWDQMGTIRSLFEEGERLHLCTAGKMDDDTTENTAIFLRTASRDSIEKWTDIIEDDVVKDPQNVEHPSERKHKGFKDLS